MIEAGTQDAEWIRAATAGDRTAFAQLYTRYRERVLRRVSHLVGPTSTVDDLVQDTFIKAFRSLSSFRGECPFPYWLLRIATRIAFEERRRARRSIWRVFIAPEEERVREQQAAAAQERYPELVAVHGALNRLSPRLREAVILFELEGRSLAEIAEELALPLATIAARVRRGREQLKRHLVRMGFGDLAESRMTLCQGEAA